MNTTSFKQLKNFTLLVLFIIGLTNCNENLSGPENPIEAPMTEILNIPAPNAQDNLYSPILKVGWKGISQNSIIKGYWVSWKSQYLLMNKTIIQEPYFTEDVAQTIPFPSADSINKQILYVRAEDQNGRIDTEGDSVTFFTSKTLPPQTFIEFPSNLSTAFIMDKSTTTWNGVKIIVAATTEFGALKDYTIQIDDYNWSDWKPDSIFYLTKENIEGINSGKHTIKVKSRNSALVEDESPAEIEMTFITAFHEKEWLVIDDTKDQNGTLERPNDEQVDSFYERLLSDVQHDNWDLTNDGMISKELMGNYKYVLWHCDDNSKTSLPEYAGIITDYLNTQGRLLLSGWNYYSFFDPDGDWADSTEYYGNLLTDYLHINDAQTIGDALLDSVFIANSNGTISFAEVDSNKIWSFRLGLPKVINFSNRGAFTEPLFGYHATDSLGNNHMGKIIGMGYHNSEYQLVVSGFPFYYLTEESAKLIFLRSKEYLETEFLY